MRFAFWMSFILSFNFAYADCNYGPTDFLVYSLHGIHEKNSDFQGLTGAEGDISVSSFMIARPSDAGCASLIAGGDFTLFEGQVRNGGVEVGHNARLSHAKVEGSVFYGGEVGIDEADLKSSEQRITDNVRNLHGISESFLAASEKISRIPLEVQKPSFEGDVLRFRSDEDIRAFEVNVEQLRRAKVLIFEGRRSALFVVNVRGDDGAMDHQDMILRDGISSGQVLFNFPEATHLKLSSSGSKDFGLAMTVLAPRARTEFISCRVTGGLYVGDLEGDGQVNPSSFPWGKIPLPGEGGCHCPHGCHEGCHPDVDGNQAQILQPSVSKTNE